MNEPQPDERFSAATRAALVEMVDSAPAARTVSAARRVHALQAVVAVAVVALVVAVSAVVLARAPGSFIGGTASDSPIPSPSAVPCGGEQPDGFAPFGCDQYIFDTEENADWARAGLRLQFALQPDGPSVGVGTQCNGFGAALRLTTTSMQIPEGNVPVTAAGCAEDHVEEALTFLQQPVDWSLSDDVLTLTSRDAVIRLRSASAVFAPQRVSCSGGLDGIEPFGCGSWVSTDGTDAHGDVAWPRQHRLFVQFGRQGQDATVDVSGALCPGFRATVALTMSDFRVRTRTTNPQHCLTGGNSADVLAFFGRPVTWRLSGDELTLTSGGTVLHLRRQTSP